jgi:hypothetical protein
VFNGYQIKKRALPVHFTKMLLYNRQEGGYPYLLSSSGPRLHQRWDDEKDITLPEETINTLVASTCLVVKLMEQ